MRRARKTLSLALGLGLAMSLGTAATAQEKIVLHGASQFDEKHAFTRLMRKFEELVQLYYTGDAELEFVMHLNRELGLEKDYFNYMSQGVSVDYAIVAPSHMSTFSKMATLLDMPMLFRDQMHWSKVLGSDVLEPIERDVREKADVMLIGYGGGGVRNLIVNEKLSDVEAIADVPIRVMGAPIQTEMFQAFGMAPTVIAYAEVYNAIQTGVIDAAENEAAGIEQMKFYEVGPYIPQTQHSITVRPLAFSGKTFDRLPEDLQAAILQAGEDAGAFGRVVEATEDRQKLLQMAEEGKLEVVDFAGREELLEAAEPVKEAYAEELGAGAVLDAINAIQ